MGYALLLCVVLLPLAVLVDLGMAWLLDEPTSWGRVFWLAASGAVIGYLPDWQQQRCAGRSESGRRAEPEPTGPQGAGVRTAFLVLVGIVAAAGMGLSVFFWVTGPPDLAVLFLVTSLVTIPAGLLVVAKPRPLGRSRPEGGDPGDDELPPGGAAIAVHRPAGYWLNAARRYEIDVDGQLAGRVQRGTTVVIDVAPGRHTVSAWVDWGSSSELSVDVPAGHRASFTVVPGPPIAAFTRPSQTLELTRSQPGDAVPHPPSTTP